MQDENIQDIEEMQDEDIEKMQDEDMQYDPLDQVYKANIKSRTSKYRTTHENEILKMRDEFYKIHGDKNIALILDYYASQNKAIKQYLLDTKAVERLSPKLRWEFTDNATRLKLILSWTKIKYSM